MPANVISSYWPEPLSGGIGEHAYDTDPAIRDEVRLLRYMNLNDGGESRT